MAKKRKTLVKDFKEIVETGDIEKIKEVFQKSDINATSGYYKLNALSFTELPTEMYTWLVEEGADINQVGDYGKTPIFNHLYTLHCENLQLLIDLGADIEVNKSSGETPLFLATGNFQLKPMEILIHNGANVHQKNNSQENPLAYALNRCNNADISSMVVIAKRFIGAGIEITEQMKQRVKKIGENFEFHRENFNPDSLEETDRELLELYQLFQVEAVPRRVVYDGKSPIIAKPTTWEAQHQELWELLVPSSGHAKTVQGEVIRISGRISYELFDNDGMNWDNQFKKMLKSFAKYLQMGNSIADEKIAKINNINTDSEDETINRLCEIAVEWVKLNPQPIALEKVDYTR